MGMMNESIALATITNIKMVIMFLINHTACPYYSCPKLMDL